MIDWMTGLACYLFVGILVTEIMLTWCANHAPHITIAYESSPSVRKLFAYLILSAIWPVAVIALIAYPRR